MYILSKLITFCYLWWMRRPPDNVELFECLEKAEKNYINVMYYYYYYFIIADLFNG